MDMSAIADEEEELLFDGCKFKVMFVHKALGSHGEPLNVVVL